MSELLLDRAGRHRSPATMPGFLAGRSPRNKGLRYPADPPKVEEIIAVMRAGDGAHGRRLRGLVVTLWRAGLRIQEALALTEADLDQRRGSLLVRRGKGGRRREVGMDNWGWQELKPWLQMRVELPIGPLFCVINGATRGRGQPRPPARNSDAPRSRLACAGASPRTSFATPTMARGGVALIVIQRLLGHSNLGITSVYLQGIDNAEINRHRPRPTRTDDSRQRFATTLKRPLLAQSSTHRVGGRRSLLVPCERLIALMRRR